MLAEFSLRLRGFWLWFEQRNLSEKFAVVSFCVLILTAFVIGRWVEQVIERSAVQNSATTSALYMDSFVAPLVQELALLDRLSDKSSAALAEQLENTELGKRVASMKIWKPGGLVAYSSYPEDIAKIFPVTKELALALSGTVSAGYDQLVDLEDANVRAIGVPMLEIYSPIRDQKTEKVVAVAEFYERADGLRAEIFRAKLNSWLFVAGMTLAVYATLFGVVRSGSQTIVRQQVSLENRVQELSALRNRLRNSSRNSAEINERFLRRIGSDLHDGPAQLLGLALLRLGKLNNSVALGKPVNKCMDSEVGMLESILTDAMSEIRNLSEGLSLPEIDSVTPTEVLDLVVAVHQRRTGMRIQLDVSDLPSDVNKSIGICLYRFVQESLNNVYRHSGVMRADIMAKCGGGTLEVEVRDAGKGFDQSDNCIGENELGLSGLRERIGSIGGTFSLHSSIGSGTKVKASFPMSEESGDFD